MADNSQQTKVRRFPKSLHITFNGVRSDVGIVGTSKSLINEEGKIDRDSVLRVGRLPEDFQFFELHADNKPVSRMYISDGKWAVQIFTEDGKNGKKLTVERSETKKARRKGSVATASIDPGSDLLKAVTAATNEIWPNMRVAERSGGRKSQKARLTALQTQALTLVRQLAQAQKRPVEDLIKEMQLDIPLEAVHEGVAEAVAPATPAPTEAAPAERPARQAGKGRDMPASNTPAQKSGRK